MYFRRTSVDFGIDMHPNSAAPLFEFIETSRWLESEHGAPDADWSGRSGKICI